MLFKLLEDLAEQINPSLKKKKIQVASGIAHSPGSLPCSDLLNQASFPASEQVRP